METTFNFLLHIIYALMKVKLPTSPFKRFFLMVVFA